MGGQLEAIAMRHREHIDFKYGSEEYRKRTLASYQEYQQS